MLRQWLLLGQRVDFSDEAGRGKALSALLQMLPHPHLPSRLTGLPASADGRSAVAADSSAAGEDLLQLLCRVLAVVLGCGRPAEAVGAAPQFTPTHAAASSAEAGGAVHAAAYSQYCALLGAAAGTLRLAAAALTGEGSGGGGDAGSAEGAHLAALREREALLREDVEALRQQLEEAEEEADASGVDGSAAIADLAAALGAAEGELSRVCAEVEQAAHSCDALPSASAGLAAAGARLSEEPDALATALGQRYIQRALGIVAAAAGGEGVRVSFPLHQCLALPAMQNGLAAALAAFDVSPVLAAACGLLASESPAPAAAGGFTNASEGAAPAPSPGRGAVAAARSLRPRQLPWLTSLVMPTLRDAAAGEPADDDAATTALLAVRALSRLALSQPCPEHAADVYEAALALVAPLALGAPTSGDAAAAAGAAELQLAALALFSDALQAIPRPCLAASAAEGAEGCDGVAADEAVAEWLSIRAAEGAAAAGPVPPALALRHIPLLLLEALKTHTGGAAAGAAGAVAWAAAWGLTQAVLTGRLSLLAEEAVDTAAAAAAAHPSPEAVAALPLVFTVLYRQVAAETAAADSAGPTTPLPDQPAAPADGAAAGSGARLSAALHLIAGASSQHAALLLRAAGQATCTLATAAAASEVAVPAAAARATGKRGAAAKGAASAPEAGGSRAAALLQAASAAHAASAAVSATAAARPKRAAAVAGRAEVAAMVASESDGHGSDASGSSDDEPVPAAGGARAKAARKTAQGIRGSSGEESDGSEVSGAGSGSSSGSEEDEDAGFSRKRKGQSKKGKPKGPAAPKAATKARAAKKAPTVRATTAAGARKTSTAPPAAPGGLGDGAAHADVTALSSISLPPAQSADPLRVALCVLLSLAHAACGSPQLTASAAEAAPAVGDHWGWVGANPALAPALAGSQLLACALAAADSGSAGVVGEVLSLLGDEAGPMALLTRSLAAAAAAAMEAACLPGEPAAAEAFARPAFVAGALQLLLGAAAEAGGLTAAQRKAAQGMQAFASDRWALAAAAAAAATEGEVGADSAAAPVAAAGGLSLAAALVEAAAPVVA
jgi:hypothetical protein